MTPMSRPLALVTGASSGIGAELARVLAGRGHDLILVARSREPLERLARTWTAEHGVTVEIEVADLSAAGAGSALAERLFAGGRRPDVLVNNAGFGLAGPFREHDPAELSRMIAVNVTAVTELCRACLPVMIERRRGGILNVSSLAAFQPGPFMAVYYATKAYVLSLSEALHEECRGTGVAVTALCPGPVETGFAARAAMTETRLFSTGLLPKMDAARVAELGVAGLMRGKRVVVPGAVSALLAATSGLVPRALALPMTRYLQSPRRR
jgi:short-subunit dehydrogenase